MEKKNGRPKGSKDKSARKKRQQLGYSRLEAQRVSDLIGKGLTVSEISIQTGFSSSQIKKIKKDFNLKSINVRCYKSLTPRRTKGDICGIYAIIIYRSKNRGARAYIGSSYDVENRIYNHKRKLSNSTHYNSEMNVDAKDCHKIEFKLIEECQEEQLLSRETYYLKKYTGLYNKWKNTGIEDSDTLQALEIIKNKNRLKYEIKDNGCWECPHTNKSGYGTDITVTVCGQTKYIKPHRASVYVHTGEYPELVRHLCDNKRCVNPDHLCGGSHKQNCADKKR